jgi:hypothetical protein
MHCCVNDAIEATVYRVERKLFDDLLFKRKPDRHRHVCFPHNCSRECRPGISSGEPHHNLVSNRFFNKRIVWQIFKSCAHIDNGIVDKIGNNPPVTLNVFCRVTP